MFFSWFECWFYWLRCCFIVPCRSSLMLSSVVCVLRLFFLSSRLSAILGTPIRILLLSFVLLSLFFLFCFFFFPILLLFSRNFLLVLLVLVVGLVVINFHWFQSIRNPREVDLQLTSVTKAGRERIDGIHANNWLFTNFLLTYGKIVVTAHVGLLGIWGLWLWCIFQVFIELVTLAGNPFSATLIQTSKPMAFFHLLWGVGSLTWVA